MASKRSTSSKPKAAKAKTSKRKAAKRKAAPKRRRGTRSTTSKAKRSHGSKAATVIVELQGKAPLARAPIGGSLTPGRPTAFTPEVRELVLERVFKGVHPERAFLAAGVSRRTYFGWRARARNGETEFVELFEAIEIAEAQGEAADVEVTAEASRREAILPHCRSCNAPARCKCGAPIEIDPSTVVGAEQANVMAAGIATQRLSNRFGRRWNPSTKQVLEAEQEHFLDVAERVLAPEVFAALLRAYVEEESAGETEPDRSPQPRRLH
jgi:hypothetical protein